MVQPTDSSLSVDAARSLPVRIDIEYIDRVNLSMEQAGTPLISRVSLTNTSDQDLTGLDIAISVANGEFTSIDAKVDLLPANGTFNLVPTGLRLDSQRLAGRTESEKTMLSVAVTSSLGTATKDLSLEILTFDQWPGTGILPEVLAAFVTPNHDRVGELLSAARKSLQEISGRDAIDGYQSGSRERATQIAEAGFNAALGLGIGYINPPASFDQTGQRIRLIDRVCKERLGCCLDLAVLLASVWEQAGLHPLVVLVEGHAFPAFWTHEAQLPEPALDDAAQVRNLVQLGEVVPVEATILCDAKGTFAHAVAAAKDRLEKPGNRFCAIDVRCARKLGIKPLPLRSENGQSVLEVEKLDIDPAASATSLDPVALAERAERARQRLAEQRSSESPSERVRRWQSRLLDLSLLNRLVNFKESKRTLQLAVEDLARFENGLASGTRYVLQPKTDGDAAFRAEQLASRNIYSTATPAVTQETLLTLYRTRKAAIDETGANPLYLALGMLKWFESESSELVRKAPILLLPVQLVRTIAGVGYRYELALSEEPIRPNFTLLEKLRVQFGLDISRLSALPEDENGIDVPLVLRDFREAIRNTKRWEVEDSAFLGLFSFNKFLMWRDLQDHVGTLKSNKLVSHLLDRPNEPFSDGPLPEPDTLDTDLSPGSLFCTRDADSTQLAAIRGAADGHTFVLEGPPGTGKSQTIANIVADSIARGKRVLFVAEKMAALNVVKDRLTKDGLGEFCLELHSAKASKKDVLLQLQSALEAAPASAPADWTETCEQLTQERAQLNGYVRELHARRASGETLYQVMGRLSQLGDGPRLSPAAGRFDTVKDFQLRDWREGTRELAGRAGSIDPPSGHPLRGIGRAEWSFALPDQASSAIDSALQAVAGLKKAIDGCVEQVAGKSEALTWSRPSLIAFASIAALVAKCPGTHPDLLVSRDTPAWIAQMRELLTLGVKRDADEASLLKKYRPDILTQDLGALQLAVTKAVSKTGLFGSLARWSVRRKCRALCLSTVPSILELQTDLEIARITRLATTRLSGSVDASRLFGASWRGGRAEWKSLQAVVDWSEEASKQLRVLNDDSRTERLVQPLAAQAADGGSRLQASAKGLVAAWNTWQAAWGTLKSTLRTSSAEAFGDGESADWLETVQRVLTRWRSGFVHLNEWCDWRAARDRACAIGLGDLVAAYEAGRIDRLQIVTAFERGYGHAWFNAVADTVDVIREFSTQKQEGRIGRFRELDARIIAKTHAVIRAKLNEKRPAVSAGASPQSESGILQRELQKKARHIPTRKLIESIPNLLTRLKPCFLMSPLSVAQYLDARLPRFDLVIFDEASQIPVWDAIGAIARGTEVIVVGDSKQLPPTSFFKTVDGDADMETAEGEIEDMESILQECNASQIPQMLLAWHYRSQHESLISFSNHHYYKNRLHTFPSPVDRSDKLGVTMQYLKDGLYDRGGSTTNRTEALAVVAEVVALLRDPANRDSIGVVTFNQSQQVLIEDLLDEQRRIHPEIDRHFTAEVSEPVFVKNLENVQGDERDTILFSIGYGPDAQGRISMNFGPLNADGGERRLNVAVTRARRRLRVFTSIKAEHIDLRRTRAIGVAHFKTFLDYAERGPKAIAEATTLPHAAEYDSAFEQAVHGALVAKGWAVDTQVGCAGYRIDLAVRDPDRPGRYLLGIECDGATYHSAKTARDRDRLREGVLRSLGWTIARVWSTDWKINPDRCIVALEAALRKACEKVERPPTQPSENEPLLKSIGQPSPASVDGIAAPVEPSVMVLTPKIPKYVAATCTIRIPRGLDVSEPRAMASMVQAAVDIVSVEGPVTEETLVRRIAEWFEIGRVTDRVRGRISDALRQSVIDRRLHQSGDAFWLTAEKASAYAEFRVSGPDAASSREIDQVPIVELRNAVVHVVTEQFGLPREELERQVGRVFGIQRLSERARHRIREAIELALLSQRIKSDDNRIVVGR